MRLWAVNTEKAEEKSPVVGTIMVRNNTEQWFPQSAAMHTQWGRGSREDGSTMTAESIVGYLAPLQPSAHAHCLSLETTKVLCSGCHLRKLLTLPL